MEKLLEKLRKALDRCMENDVLYEHSHKIETRVAFEDALDEYIDRRIEDALDQHINGYLHNNSDY